MLISRKFLVAMNACTPSMTQYDKRLGTGDYPYWPAYNYMIANPPTTIADMPAWKLFLDNLQTNPAALKYGGRYKSGNAWRLHSNNKDIFYTTLAAAKSQRTRDMNTLLGDLNVRYNTVQIITTPGHTLYIPLANATKDEVSKFQLTDESHNKYDIIGWTATQAKVKALAAAFRLTTWEIIYEKIVDTDDGFIAWDPLPIK